MLLRIHCLGCIKISKKTLRETSIPFRPSFSFASFMKSCSDNQFDPLGSNIIHPKQVTTSDSPKGTVVSTVWQHTSSPVLAGDLKPGHDANKSANSFNSASEGMLCIKGAAHKYLSDTTTVAPGLTTNDEKGHIPHMTDPAPINDAKVGNNMRDINEVDDIMESKSMKILYADLVDFLKELLKPRWKEGLLSRGTHKLIVKKTTKKVLGA